MESITGDAQNNSFLEDRFFEILDEYETAYGPQEFKDEEWFVNKSISIEGDGIF
jgi:hypothetical protein